MPGFPNKPYMRKVRGSGERRMNALDAGPLHDQLRTHISKLIDIPELLLADDASYLTGSLDGQVWERPEAFYAIHCIKNSLPYLRGCLIAFLKGALETWHRFASEYAEGGVIAGLSRDEKDRLWIDTTNDVNEGALGTTRQHFHHAPNISLPKLNARMMYRKNDTGSFIERVFNKPHQRSFMRSEARIQDASHIPQTSRKAELLHDEEVVSQKRAKDVERKAKSDARVGALDALQLELDVEMLRLGQKTTGQKIRVDELHLQITWHRRHDSNIQSKKIISKMKKEDLLQELIAIVKRLPGNFFPDNYRNIHPPEDVNMSVHEEWDEVEEREDADMMEGR